MLSDDIVMHHDDVWDCLITGTSDNINWCWIKMVAMLNNFRLCVFLLVICRLLYRVSSPNMLYPCPGPRHCLSFVHLKCGLVKIEENYSWRACGRHPLTSTCFHRGLNVCLLICGDIQINPCPVIRLPCCICDKPVRCIDAALLCYGCDQWVHCCCSGLSQLLYVEYQACSKFDWLCSKCLNAQLPVYDC